VNPVIMKLVRTQMRDALRSRWIAWYAGLFLVLAEAVLRFSGTGPKAVLTLSTASLMVIPLASLVLSTIYMYGAREFIELMLAQPIRRSALFAGLYLGLAVPMALAFVAAVGIPFAARWGEATSQLGAIVTLLVTGAALTAICTALAFCIALRSEDRLRGLGTALGVWLLLAVVYDGVVLLAVALFSDYPIERPLLGLTLANPIDLARVLMLLRLDVAALMGYTGAVFERFFGGGAGIALAAGALAAWLALPLAFAARQFRRKDF
jgi:Cu-processing system permease protein